MIISITTFPRRTADRTTMPQRTLGGELKEKKNFSTGGRLFVFIFIYDRYAYRNIRILLIHDTDTIYSVYLYYTLLILVRYRPVADTCFYNNIIIIYIM